MQCQVKRVRGNVSGRDASCCEEPVSSKQARFQGDVRVHKASIQDAEIPSTTLPGISCRALMSGPFQDQDRTRTSTSNVPLNSKSQQKTARRKTSGPFRLRIFRSAEAYLAAARTASLVMPSSLNTMLPGALMPKRSMPRTLPSRPTYLYQRPETPASMAMFHGRPLYRMKSF